MEIFIFCYFLSQKIVIENLLIFFFFVKKENRNLFLSRVFMFENNYLGGLFLLYIYKGEKNVFCWESSILDCYLVWSRSKIQISFLGG